MYIYNEQDILLDTEQIIECSQNLSKLYLQNADYEHMRHYTDLIDRQTVAYIHYRTKFEIPRSKSNIV